ncbi:MAG: hypothetical protein FJW39_05150 [Acidobacteria bacterium]|nr:hypothetical protein [Acidobacteriota bacterium]
MRPGLLLAATYALGAVTIPEASLHQYEDGPSVPAAQAFSPGDPVHVSFLIAAYTKTGEETPRVKITWTIDAFDPKGVRLAEPKSEVIDAPLAAQDKDWKPKKRHEFFIPPLADTGDYKVTITVRDELAGKTVTRDIRLPVRSPYTVEASTELVQRNFRFLRTEDDTRPLTPPSYRPGDTLWARFEITGYKFGPKNSFDVAYGLEVLRADGSRLFAEPNAAAEKESAYYPKRYVQGALSLNLQKDIPKGSYTIVLKLRDTAGKQTAESKHVFQVD